MFCFLFLCRLHPNNHSILGWIWNQVFIVPYPYQPGVCASKLYFLLKEVNEEYNERMNYYKDHHPNCID
jgi:hypothetical protein